MDYRVEDRSFAKGKIVIQRLVKGEKVDAEKSGLSKREWNELMSAFNFEDKLSTYLQNSNIARFHYLDFLQQLVCHYLLISLLQD